MRRKLPPRKLYDRYQMAANAILWAAVVLVCVVVLIQGSAEHFSHLGYLSVDCFTLAIAIYAHAWLKDQAKDVRRKAWREHIAKRVSYVDGCYTPLVNAIAETAVGKLDTESVLRQIDLAMQFDASHGGDFGTVFLEEVSRTIDADMSLEERLRLEIALWRALDVAKSRDCQRDIAMYEVWMGS